MASFAASSPSNTGAMYSNDYGSKRASTELSKLVAPGLLTWVLGVFSILFGCALLQSFPSVKEVTAESSSCARHHRDDALMTNFFRILGWAGIIGGILMLVLIGVMIPVRMLAYPIQLNIKRDE